MKMSKNLIKVLAACGDDIDLEEIYNEIGLLLGKDENPQVTTNQEIKETVKSLKDYNGMEFEYISDACLYMTKNGFEVIENHVYNGSESALITRIVEKGTYRSVYKIVCDN